MNTLKLLTLPIMVCLALAIVAALLPGCAPRIDQAGVYGSAGNSPFGTNDNSFLLLSDKAIGDSKDEISAFLSWEMQNRAVLATIAPNVTKVADSLRDQAPAYFTNLYLLRSNYVWAFKRGASVAAASNSFFVSVQTLGTLALSSAQLTNSVNLH